MMPKGVQPRRFLVVDAQVQELYGSKIQAYFDHHGVQTHVVVLPGGNAERSSNQSSGRRRERSTTSGPWPWRPFSKSAASLGEHGNALAK
eukprot:scaffold1112_cov86-Pinguiococcus_pyrenoidosus.AAC.1